jgi:hypothetical protein
MKGWRLELHFYDLFIVIAVYVSVMAFICWFVGGWKILIFSLPFFAGFLLSTRINLLRKREEISKSLEKELADFDINKKLFNMKIEMDKKDLAEEKEAIKTLAEEKSKGFPWLANAYADFFELVNLKKAEELESKSHPALKSADRVRELAKERRIIEIKLRIAQGIINYYQDLFPFLEDFLDEEDEALLLQVLSRNIDKPIQEIGELGSELEIDPVRFYLSKEEYLKLTTAERNQMALDRYWDRHKNKSENLGSGLYLAVCDYFLHLLPELQILLHFPLHVAHASAHPGISQAELLANFPQSQSQHPPG